MNNNFISTFNDNFIEKNIIYARSKIYSIEMAIKDNHIYFYNGKKITKHRIRKKYIMLCDTIKALAALENNKQQFSTILQLKFNKFKFIDSPNIANNFSIELLLDFYDPTPINPSLIADKQRLIMTTVKQRKNYNDNYKKLFT